MSTVSFIPETPEQFQLWMVQQVGDIHTANAAILGEIKTALANHDALEKRVESVEDDAKDARKWENIKFAGAGFVQGVIIWFKHSGAVHTAQSIASLLGF
jgi:hypothetical protein